MHQPGAGRGPASVSGNLRWLRGPGFGVR